MNSEDLNQNQNQKKLLFTKYAQTNKEFVVVFQELLVHTVHMFVHHTYTHIYIYTYTHIYIHIHTYTYTHIQYIYIYIYIYMT